jgi:hypothetical protein
MIFVTLAGAALLRVSDPVDAARSAERAYFACLLKAADQIDGPYSSAVVIAADIEASCQDEAWAYLAAQKRAGRSGNVSDEACKAIRTERHLPRIPAYRRKGRQGPFCGG